VIWRSLGAPILGGICDRRTQLLLQHAAQLSRHLPVIAALGSQAMPMHSGRLPLDRIKPKLLREFTHHLGQVRHCGPATINQRLAALRAWAHFVATQSPEHLEWSTQVQTIHLKKCASAPVSYLEKAEMQALLNQPDREAPQGLRDYGFAPVFVQHGRACQ